MENTKKCIKCLEHKPVIEFYNNKNYKDGKNSRCKRCCNEKKYEWNRKHPEHFKKRMLLKYYNMTIEDYNSILIKQDYKCAICGINQSETPSSKFVKNRAFAVDHNHSTGKVRGLLCGKCNMGIGGFNESIVILDKAKQYIMLNL
jgi:hypothetical protein